MGKISRKRGYAFEHEFQNWFSTLGFGWYSKRLGGTAVNFPDLVVTNNKIQTLIAVEAKAGTMDNYYVPIDEIQRCFDCCKMFSIYKHKFIIFAFHFHGKRSHKRLVKEYFLLINNKAIDQMLERDEFMTKVICSYHNGIKYDLEWEGINLDDKVGIGQVTERYQLRQVLEMSISFDTIIIPSQSFSYLTVKDK